MDQIQYIGETLWPSQLGKILIILGFIASGLAMVSYAFATNKRDSEEAPIWTRIGRVSFSIHGISIITVILLIFYVMINQMYEYQYVQAHVSDDLPMRYIFSAFWEGQEGSFLLWMFWHIVLGMIILFKKGKWEAPVLSIMSLLQLILSSMILGLYFNFGSLEFKLGSNPILLLRDVMDAPIFANADYLNLIQGTGLNELLQNYWMTIHPPTLFLGFASTAIPFCFAIAGLWTKEYEAWLKPALGWALFSSFFLGTGVLMGAAWAYEALTFGGYWAWDPVENMSLVPWLILIAGLHTHLVAKATGYSIRSTFIFYILSFVLILYSTFLTRSGILGDTSAHAFTEMGLEWQLVTLILTFAGLGIFFLAKSWKNIPSPKKEEAISSREFWMFIGSLVLFFSGLLIASSTSLPVYNKIIQYFKPEHVGLVINDPIDHYNRYQLWIGIFVSMISGAAILLRYSEFNWAKRMKKYFTVIGISLLASIVLNYLFGLWIEVNAWQYHLLSTAAFFVILTNGYYLVKTLRLNLKAAGSVLSHTGFGLMILGIMASGLSKDYITSIPFVQKGLLDDELIKTSAILMKEKPIFMNEYWVTYEGDTLDGHFKSYEINFKKINDDGDVIDEFDLYPTSQMSNDMTKVAAFNPDTKRKIHTDVFTAVRTLPRPQMDSKFAKEMEDTIKYQLYNLNPGEVIDSSRYKVEVLGIQPEVDQDLVDGAHLGLTLNLKITDKDEDSIYHASPALILDGMLVYSIFKEIPSLNMRVRLSESFFNEYYTEDGKLGYQDFRLKEGETFTYNGYRVSISGFEREVENKNYEREEGDIAIGAKLKVENLNEEGLNYEVEPIYIIRGNRPFSIKDYVAAEGLHFRFKNIDPNAGIFTISMAKEEHDFDSIPVEIATNVPRSDIIVLEAIIFPGINLVWLGTILMMIGLLASLIYRSKKSKLENVS